MPDLRQEGQDVRPEVHGETILTGMQIFWLGWASGVGGAVIAVAACLVGGVIR